MLTPIGKKAFNLLFQLGCATALYPFQYDPITHSLTKAGKKQMLFFRVHKFVMYNVTIFAAVRLVQAWVRGGFPLTLKILNIVFLAAYILTSISQIQFERKEREILQFMNILLRHVFGHNVSDEEAGSSKRAKEILSKVESLDERSPKDVDFEMQQVEKSVRMVSQEKSNVKEAKKTKKGKVKPIQPCLTSMQSCSMEAPDKLPATELTATQIQQEESHTSKRITQCFIFGMLLLAANPSVHVKLVQESPCTPSFLISLYYPSCHDFEDNDISLAQRLPWMIPEYYFTTMMFSSWSFNWAAIFIGTSLMIENLRRMGHNLGNRQRIQIQAYRQNEVISKMMNDAFIMYLATFPSLLFAIVSILMFGVIRIWQQDPGSNLMFPLCGVRCSFEAVTPLQAAVNLNERNIEAKRRWKREVPRRKKEKQALLRTYYRSMNNVRCHAGSLYSFENSIVLTCLNNTFILTLNMLVTFKYQ